MDALTRNATGARIAVAVEMAQAFLPKDVVQLIPLEGVSQGRTLPDYLSPEAPAWAVLVGLASEGFELLCGLFMAAANFLKELMERIVDWGLKLLGPLLDALGIAKYLFAMAMMICSWIQAAFVALLFLSVGFILSVVGINVNYSWNYLLFAVSISNFDLNICACIASFDFYGFLIAMIRIDVAGNMVMFSTMYHLSITLEYSLTPFVLHYSTSLNVPSFSGKLIKDIQCKSAIDYYEKDPLTGTLMEAIERLDAIGAFTLILTPVVISTYVAACFISEGDNLIKKNNPIAIATGLASYLISILYNIFGTLGLSHLLITSSLREKSYSSASYLLNAYASAQCYLVFIVPLILAALCSLLEQKYPEKELLIDIAIFIIELVTGSLLKAIGKGWWLYFMVGFLVSIASEVVEIALESKIHKFVKKLTKKAPGKGAKVMHGILLLLLVPINIALYYAYMDEFFRWGGELEVPEIERDLRCLDAQSNSIARLDFNITISDNYDLHYVVIDIATKGERYRPTTSGKITNIDRVRSRLYAEGVRKIFNLIEIRVYQGERLILGVRDPDGDFQEFQIAFGDYKVIHFDEGYINVSFYGNISIIYDLTVYSNSIEEGMELYLVCWACDWIDNEAISVDNPSTKTRGGVRYNISIHNTRENCKVLGVDKDQQSIRCGFKISNVLEYPSLIFSSAKSLRTLHNDAFIFVIFIIGQARLFSEHTLTVNAPQSMLRLPYNDRDKDEAPKKS